MQRRPLAKVKEELRIRSNITSDKSRIEKKSIV
jgi:hypothetical protein